MHHSVQGPKDCYPMYRFGFEPLLICGNGNADIDLAVGTGKQEGDGNAGREHQECTLTVQNNTSSQPTPSTTKKMFSTISRDSYNSNDYKSKRY